MDLLASLLAVEPAQRCTCAQALRHDFFRRHLGPCTPGAPMPPAPAPAPAPAHAHVHAHVHAHAQRTRTRIACTENKAAIPE